MSNIVKINNTIVNHSEEIIKNKFAIPFFNFEKSKNEALEFYEKIAESNSTLDDNKIKYIASTKLINDYANKTGNIGAGLCLFSLVPFLESFCSVSSIPIELAILTRYNLHLMVKLSVINDYPLADDDFVDALIRSAKTHDIGASIARFIFRLVGAIPLLGQTLSIVIGCPICAYINRKETLKFGKNILKEYNLDYELNNNINLFSMIKKIFPWIIIISLFGYIYIDKYNFHKINPVPNTSIEATAFENIKTSNNLIASLQEILQIQNTLIEDFKNDSKENNDKKFVSFYKMLGEKSIEITSYENENVIHTYDKEELLKILKKENIKFIDNKKLEEISLVAYPIYNFGYYSSARINYEYLIKQFSPYLGEQWIAYLLLMQEQENDTHNVKPNEDGVDISFSMKWQNKLEVFLNTYPNFYMKEDIEKDINAYKANLKEMGY